MRIILGIIRTKVSSQNVLTDEPLKTSQICCNSSHLCKQLRVSLHRLTPAETAELRTVIKKPTKKTKHEWRIKVSKRI